MELEDTGQFRGILQSDSPSEIKLIDFQEIDTSKKNAIKEGYFLGAETRIESLRIWVNIPNFHPDNLAKVPEILPDDYESVKVQKLMEVWDAYPLLAIELLERESDTEPWLAVAEIKLQNRGFAYYIDGLVPHLASDEVLLVSERYQLGARLKDMGDGLFGSGDSALLRGSWSQRLTGTPNTQGIVNLVEVIPPSPDV